MEEPRPDCPSSPDHHKPWSPKHGGPRLIWWSIQWAMAIALPILAIAYAGEFIVQGTVSWGPLQWVGAMMAAILVLLWINWLRDGSWTRKV